MGRVDGKSKKGFIHIYIYTYILYMITYIGFRLLEDSVMR